MSVPLEAFSERVELIRDLHARAQASSWRDPHGWWFADVDTLLRVLDHTREELERVRRRCTELEDQLLERDE